MSMKDLTDFKISITRIVGALVILVPVLLATGGYIKDVEELQKTTAQQGRIIAEMQQDNKNIELHLAAISAQLEIIMKNLERNEQKSRNYR